MLLRESIENLEPASLFAYSLGIFDRNGHDRFDVVMIGSVRSSTGEGMSNLMNCICGLL